VKKPVSKFAFQMQPAALHQGPPVVGARRKLNAVVATHSLLTLNPKPKTQNPKPKTQNPKPTGFVSSTLEPIASDEKLVSPNLVGFQNGSTCSATRWSELGEAFNGMTTFNNSAGGVCNFKQTAAGVEISGTSGHSAYVRIRLTTPEFFSRWGSAG
jgi:hypothetical protein